MLRTVRQNARMSKITNGGLDQYGVDPFEQQQFGTAGVEGVNSVGLDNRRPIRFTSASSVSGFL